MTERYGIDISRAQGAIDWDTLAQNADLSFVLIRAAQGTAQDTYFARNIREVQRVGIPFGLYFAASATTAEGVREEAAAAIDCCRLYKPVLGAWYDMELPRHRALGRDGVNALLHCWLDAVRGAGQRCGIYTNKNWLDTLIDHSLLTDCDLWYAAYPSTARKALTDAPPNNRQKLSYPQAAIWQWSSAGRVDGIVGNVDLNVCYEDLAPVTAAPEKGYITLAEAKALLQAQGYAGIVI